MKKCICTCWVVFAAAVLLLMAAKVSAQADVFRLADSVRQLLAHAQTDTEKIRLMSVLGERYFAIDPNSGFAYSEKALRFAQKIRWKKGEALALLAMGSNYWAKTDYLKYQDCLLQVRDIALYLNDSAMLSSAYHNLAFSYLPLSNTDKGIYYLLQSLAIEQHGTDYLHLMSLYHNLGDVYEEKQDYRQALAYYTYALPFALKIDDQHHIAFTYMKIGSFQVALDSLEKGFANLQKSLRLSRLINKPTIEVRALMSCAFFYQKQKKYGQAVACYDSALTISATFKATYFIGQHGTYLLAAAQLYREKAAYERENGQLAQAKFDESKACRLLKKALLVSHSMQDYAAMRDESLALSKLYERAGNNVEALHLYKMHMAWRDSTTNTEKAKQQLQHDMQSEFHDSLQYIQKLDEKHLQLLAQENKLSHYRTNQVLLVFVIIIVVLLFLSALTFNHYRLQKMRLHNALQTEKLQKQLQEADMQRKLNDATLAALHSQMNPHFMFNVLNTIQSFIYTDNKRAAAEYLGKFSELLRKILDFSQQQSISLEEELEVIRLYLFIEQARFGDNLHIKMMVNETLPVGEVMLPPLFAQPYIENALQHGLLHKQGEKKLLIEVEPTEDNSGIFIKIEDNGIGRKQSAAINKSRLSHHSFAGEANNKRVALMKKLWNRDIQVQIMDKMSLEGQATGTIIIILITQNNNTTESALTTEI